MKLLVDANLLFLYLVGKYEPDFIYSVKSLSVYSREDFLKISNIINYYKNVVITPQILAELTNMSEKDIHSVKLKEYMKVLIDDMKNFSEVYIPMATMLTNQILLTELGFSDLSLIEAGKNDGCDILTADFELSLKGRANGCNTINFASLQGKDWFANMNALTGR